jgi:hypothetical protein
MPLIRLRPVARAGLLLFLLLRVAGAAEPPPLTNHAALARGFTLPSLGAAAIVPPGQTATRAVVSLSNEFELLGFDATLTCQKTECMRLDGEAWRLSLEYRSGFAQGWEWSIGIPLLAQDGGFMDGLIEGWHGVFGMPNGGREFVPRNQYRYYYRRNGTELLDLEEPSTRLGDVRVSVGRQIGQSVVLRGQLKLPTGDASHLADGNAGGALWMDAGLPLTGRFSGYGSVGVSAAARGEVLPELQNRWIALAGSGLAYAWSPALSLHLQLYLHSRLYDDSDLRNLRREGAVLGVSARYRLDRRVWLDLGFQEDLNVNVSPDLVVQLALTWRD